MRRYSENVTFTIAISSLTDALAWVGALTGVAGLIWQVLTWRRSTHRVRIRAANSYFTYPGGELGPPQVCVDVRNAGSGAVTIETWGISGAGGGTLVPIQPHPQSASLPHRLESGSSASFYIDADALRRHSAERGVAFRRMRPWVRLGTGQRVVSRKGLLLKA